MRICIGLVGVLLIALIIGPGAFVAWLARQLFGEGEE